MAAEFVAGTLKDMGAAGAAISVLLTTVTACVTAIIFLYRQNNKLNAERRTESGTVIKLMENTNTALKSVADSSEQRNKVTQDLADAIRTQAAAFEMVNQRIEFYHDGNVEKLKDLREVVASHAEAVRVNTGMVTEVRNGNIAIAASVTDTKSIMESMRTRLESLAGRRAR